MKIVMPQIGMTMTEGYLSEWKKKENEWVEKGEPLFTIETEKLVNVIEASASGRLRIYLQEGESAPCGVEIGEIVEAQEA